MSQGMSGVDTLVKVLIPTIIGKIKSQKERIDQLEQLVRDHMAATEARLVKLETKPAAKRGRKPKENPAEAIAEVATEAAMAPATPEAVADEVANIVAAQLQQLSEGEVPQPAIPLAEPAAPVQSTDAAPVTGTSDAGIVAAIPPADAGIGAPSSTPVSVDGVSINGTVVGYVNFCIQQHNMTDAPTIAQALGIPVQAVQYVLDLSPEEQVSIQTQFPAQQV